MWLGDKSKEMDMENLAWRQEQEVAFDGTVDLDTSHSCRSRIVFFFRPMISLTTRFGNIMAVKGIVGLKVQSKNLAGHYAWSEDTKTRGEGIFVSGEKVIETNMMLDIADRVPWQSNSSLNLLDSTKFQPSKLNRSRSIKAITVSAANSIINILCIRLIFLGVMYS